MVKKRKLLLALIMGLCMIPCIANAEETDMYQKYADQYGTSYISTVSDSEINEVFCDWIEAWVEQSTNVRSRPDADADKIVTIEKDDAVKIWGYTDNNWSRVCCRTGDGSLYFGYIRSDLLTTN